MSSPTAYDAFADRLDDWTATRVVFENPMLPEIGTQETFVFVEISGSFYNQDTAGAPGSNMWIEAGVTWMHVMVPDGTGSRDARTYANDLLYLFREQAVGNLHMTEMSIGAGEPGQDFPNHWAMTATISWRRYDITSIP